MPLYPPLEWLKWKRRVTNVEENVETLSPLHIAGGNVKWCRGFEKHMLVQKTCTCVFVQELCLLAKTWKKPKCPLTDEYIYKTWYSHTTECYSPTERNEIVLHAWTRMTLKTLCSGKEAPKDCMLWHHLCKMSRTDKSRERKPINGCLGQGWGMETEIGRDY